MASILYQGHASLRMRTDAGTVIYIDPFAGDDYSMPADLILVTHQHYDHNEIDKPKRKEGCLVWQNTDALVDGEYKTLDYLDLHIEAVEAYNDNHPKDIGVGYLVTADGFTVYFAGDTNLTNQMRNDLSQRKIDLAFLPCDGDFNMGVTEALECARVLGAEHVVPIHTAPGALYDENRALRFEMPGALVMFPGEEADLI